MDNNRKYYSTLFSTQNTSNRYMNKKIDLILDNIPKDVESIIDIGAGNGTITNVLNKHYRVKGVERNEKAAKYIESEKIVGSCENINIADQSFDMVFSSELLEHLEKDIFTKSIQEMKRLSRKYIFLTFPNSETIEKDFIQCPYCKKVFNRTYHIRSLDIDDIYDLFPEYKILKTFNYGSRKRGYNKKLLEFKHKFVRPEAWIPWFWTKNTKRESMCPNCEKVFKYKYKFSTIGLICDIINMLISPHKPYWTFVILEIK
ncbi:MAG: class I SAM-dependent methyltransferase [Candidatus Helarchaeota archaeon]